MDTEITMKTKKEKPIKVRLRQNIFKRWIVIHDINNNLAWSGSQWDLISPEGIPIGYAQISNLGTYDEAKEYAESFGFEVIEDKMTRATRDALDPEWVKEQIKDIENETRRTH